MFITHDLGVIADVADDVIVMYLGRIVERAAGAGAIPRLKAPVHARTLGVPPVADRTAEKTPRCHCRKRCAPQKLDPALIPRFRHARIGRFATARRGDRRQI